jgi:hypothetical protein
MKDDTRAQFRIAERILDGTRPRRLYRDVQRVDGNDRSCKEKEEQEQDSWVDDDSIQVAFGNEEEARMVAAAPAGSSRHTYPILSKPV